MGQLYTGPSAVRIPMRVCVCARVSVCVCMRVIIKKDEDLARDLTQLYT